MERVARLFGVLACCVALGVVVAACGSSAEEAASPAEAVESAESAATSDVVDASERVPVIVDYSPTVSDVGGLMYLLAHPGVEVIAVSLPMTGEAGCDLGVEVTLGVLAMFDEEQIPVACSREVPAHARSWPPAFLEGHESLASGLPVPAVTASDESASDLIVRTAAEAGRPVVVYAVAPLTNVARALDEHPDLAGDLERIVIMGGAVDAPGNVEDTGAEWNLWIDVPAAAAVIGSEVPITLVPLDATNFVPVTDGYQRALAEAVRTDAVVYLNGLVGTFPAVTSGFYYLWDELAASVAAGESFATTEERAITVVESGPDEGRTVEGDGAPVNVAVGVSDPDAFYSDFLSTLAGSPVQVGGTAAPEEEAYFASVEASFSDLEQALADLFSNPDFADDATFDGAAFAEGIDVVMTAMGTSYEIVSMLDPPESLKGVHDSYLTKVQSIVDQQDEFVAAVANATSLEEVDALLSTAADFDDACLPLAETATRLGITVQLPCG